MSYTYTRDWCDISEAALKREPTLDPTDRFLLVQPSYIDQDTLFEQMYQVALGHPETLLDRAHYAYGLCDPCHQPTNYIRWSLANRECEQAYNLEPITGEYGESIFSLFESLGRVGMVLSKMCSRSHPRNVAV